MALVTERKALGNNKILDMFSDKFIMSKLSSFVVKLCTKVFKKLYLKIVAKSMT